LVGESFDNENRQKALGKVLGLMFLGGATASAIGGALAYLGSWRLVYLAYGIGEFIIAIVMFKMLERDKAVVEKLNIFSAYKSVLTNYRFMSLVITIFFVGFSVFGTFTYSGKLVQELTGFNVLIVGLILSIFGIGTVVGGRLAPKIRKKLKNGFLVSAGIIGFISLFALSTSKNIIVLALGFLGFGMAFIFLQSTLLATVQEKLPNMRGTAMSMASFNMFVGGAIGTSINGMIMKNYGVTRIFYNTSFVILVVGIVSAVLISRFEMRKTQREYSGSIQ
jgi:predicted MFS family arabinose efflux permease